MCMTMMEMAAVLKLASDNYLKNGDEAGTCREKETFHIIAATLRTGCLRPDPRIPHVRSWKIQNRFCHADRILP